MPFDIDVVANVIRYAVRTVLQMPQNSVRPANQNVPAGPQGQQFATVLVTDVSQVGYDQEKIVNMPDVGDPPVDPETVKWTLTGPRIVEASLQFFRGDAYSKACRAVSLLQSSFMTETLQALGLGFKSAGKVLNLTALVDDTWESRAQVNIQFCVIAQEQTILNTFGTFPIALESDDSSPANTTDFEVTGP
jgi:hypothetical protein